MSLFDSIACSVIILARWKLHFLPIHLTFCTEYWVCIPGAGRRLNARFRGARGRWPSVDCRTLPNKNDSKVAARSRASTSRRFSNSYNNHVSEQELFYWKLTIDIVQKFTSPIFQSSYSLSRGDLSATTTEVDSDSSEVLQGSSSPPETLARSMDRRRLNLRKTLLLCPKIVGAEGTRRSAGSSWKLETKLNWIKWNQGYRDVITVLLELPQHVGSVVRKSAATSEGAIAVNHEPLAGGLGGFFLQNCRRICKDTDITNE